jgi:molybdopterin-guanine dinucleotide biosynthesis protein
MPAKEAFGNRGTGRTTAIIQAAKDAAERGARVLIVGHTYEQAKRIAEQVGPRTECVGNDSVGVRLRGTNFVPFVDHHAVEMWASKVDDLLSSIREAEARTAEAEAHAEQWRVRCGASEAKAYLACARVEELEASLKALAAERDRWRGLASEMLAASTPTT